MAGKRIKPCFVHQDGDAETSHGHFQTALDLRTAFDALWKNREAFDVREYAEEEVARRWLRLNHSRVNLREEPKQAGGDALGGDKEKMGRRGGRCRATASS